MDFNYQTITAADKTAIEATIPQYETLLIENLRLLLDRYDRDPDYHFIDTKLNIITGKDFYPVAAGEEFKDKSVIYAWIQGRGLEALAGHAAWLPSATVISKAEQEHLISRIEKVLREVSNAMERCRETNNGRLFFWMRPDGQVLTTAADNRLVETATLPPQSNYSDLFYAKGLLAAAHYLNQPEKFHEAELYLKTVIEDIQNDNFLSDQQPFDIKNRVTPVAGKNMQGQWMIALGGIALGIKYGDRPYWTERAEQFINHIIKFHINTAAGDACQRYDFWEAIDDNNRPWVEDNGTIICDPGHALEFIGLSTKSLLQLAELEERNQSSDRLLEQCRRLYPELLRHFFTLGFNSTAGGICKAYDLQSRQVINSDMPWWSLPETIRAAALLLKLNPAAEDAALPVIRDASNAFMQKFINPELHLLAWQTRDRNGRPIELIPATPDADPGYHTGLSIIDFIKSWRNAPL